MTDEYKQVLKNDEQEYDAYIILDDGTKIDTDLSGFKPIYNLGQRIVGNFANKRVEFTVFNTSKYNLTDQEFEAFVGLKVGNEFVYNSIGKYIANKPQIKDEALDESSVVCNDISIKFKTKYTPVIQFPCKIRVAVKAICDHLNVEYIDNEFINADYVLNEFYIDEDATFHDVIKELAGAGFANAIITYENKLIMKSPSMSVDYKFDLNELFELKKEDNIFGPLNSIVASRIVADDGSTTEDVYARDETSITANGLHEYKIKQNEAIDYDRQTAVNNMLAGILNFKYVPASIEAVYNPMLEIGNMLEVPDKNTDTSFLLFAKELTADLMTGLMIIESTEDTKTETDYKNATQKDKRTKTELEVSKLKGKITLLSSQVSETEKELDSISTPTIKFSGKSGTIESAESNLDLTEVRGESTQKSRSGKNMAKNSSDIDYWDISGTVDTNTRLFENESVKTIQPWRGVYINFKEMYEEGKIKIGDKLVVSIYYKTNFAPTKDVIFSIYRAKDEKITKVISKNDIALNKWQRISFEIVVDSTTITSKTGRIETEYFITDDYYFNEEHTYFMWFSCPQVEFNNLTEFENYGVSPSPDFPSEIESSKNLFDLSSINEKTYLASADGSTGASNVSNVSDYIEVKANKTYTLSFDYDSLASSSNRAYCFYDKNKTFVSGGDYYPPYKKTTMTAGQDGYIRFCYDINCNNVQFQRGSTVTDYVPYKSIAIRSTTKNLLNAPGEFELTGSKVLIPFYLKAGTYILSVENIETAGTTASLISFNTAAGTTDYYYLSNSSKSKTVTFKSDVMYYNIYSQNSYNASVGVTAVFTNLMIRHENSSAEYEPHISNQANITLLHPLRSLSDDIYDRIYKKDGKWYDEQKVDVVTYDGTEEWTYYEPFRCFYRNEDGTSSSKVNMKVPATNDNINLMCNHYKGDTRNNLAANVIDNIITNNDIYSTAGQVCIRDTRFSNVASFKAELAENNLEVQYELAAPITTEITDNETIQTLENIKTYKGITNITSDVYLEANYYTNNSLNENYVNKSENGKQNRIVNEKISEFELTNEQIKSTVKDIQTNYNILSEALETVKSTMLTQTAEQFEMLFSQTGISDLVDTLQNNINGNTEQLETITEYIRFKGAQIELGKSTSQVKLVLANDRISFMTGNAESAYISNNMLYITDSTILNRLQIGRWITEEDEHHNLNTRYIGGN